LIGDPAKDEDIGLREALGPKAVRLFVRRTRPVIDASVQRDIDGISKGSHVRVPFNVQVFRAHSSPQERIVNGSERQS
jgi:hypothetical protein